MGLRSAMFAALAAALLAPAVLVAQDAAATADLEGAWLVIEMEVGGRVLGSPQPGLLLFTGRHYSYTFISGEEPRPDLPPGIATAPELLRVWNPFGANAGTYEVSGNTMRRYPIVAKNPATMAPGAFNEYTFRMTADTLWFTTVGTEAGPARSPATTRYVRIR